MALYAALTTKTAETATNVRMLAEGFKRLLSLQMKDPKADPGAKMLGEMLQRVTTKVEGRTAVGRRQGLARRAAEADRHGGREEVGIAAAAAAVCAAGEMSGYNSRRSWTVVTAMRLTISATMTTTMTSPVAELADEELACRAGRGLPACFEELVRRFQVPLLRFLIAAGAAGRRRGPGAGDVRRGLTNGCTSSRMAIASARGCSRSRSGCRSTTAAAAKPTVEMVDEGVSSCRGRGLAARAGGDARPGCGSLAKRLLTEEQFAALWLHYVEEMPAGEVARCSGGRGSA